MPELPPYESRHGFEKERNSVLVSGVARSGSTVAWQVINLLNNGKVLKSHGFQDCCPTLFRFENVIITTRHPFDAYFSAKRVWGGDNNSLHVAESQWNDVGAFLLLKNFQESTGYRSDMNITFLKYEDYWNKDSDRILFLSNTINKKVTDKKINEILLETSLGKNAEISKTGQTTTSKRDDSYSAVLPRVHLSHVGEKRGIPGQGSLLGRDVKEKILKKMEWVFDEFEYDKTI